MRWKHGFSLIFVCVVELIGYCINVNLLNIGTVYISVILH